MRISPKVVLAAAWLASALAAARPSVAAPMDPTPDRLYLNPPNLPAGWDCQRIAADPNGFVKAHPLPSGQTNVPTCLPNNDGWANMMSELGYAIAPSAFHPAGTTGFGGFALSLEASYAHINADATDSHGVQYWHQGTQGSTLPNGSYGTTNQTPDSIIQVYSLKARKGLPLGFEITGVLGYVANTTLWVGGADLHWALLEGYRTGWLGYLPDVAIGGGVRTMSGQSSFYLTTVGVDAQISKSFTIVDSAVITPYIGAQRLFIFANSANVSLTPNVDALAVCGYGGVNQSTGAVNCRNGQYASSDYNNQTVFEKQTFYRWRGLIGLTYRYELLYLGAQFATDLEDPSAENSNLSNGGQPGSVNIAGSKQWTMSAEAGVFF